MSPKTKQQYAEIRERSRQNIEEAALELFATRGYAHTTVSQIAAAAGISKGLLYNYYESKEALLYSIVEGAIAESELWWFEIMQQDLPAVQQIRLITEKSIGVVRDNLRHWKLMASLAFQPDIMQGLNVDIMQRKQGMVQTLQQLFERLGVEDTLAEVLFYSATLDGMFMHYMNMPEAYPMETMVEYLLKRYNA
jgi:AcrR family transcriptional regulator